MATQDIYPLILEVLRNAKALSDSFANLIIVLIGLGGYNIPLWAIQVLMVILAGLAIYEFASKMGKWVLLIMVLILILSAAGLMPV